MLSRGTAPKNQEMVVRTDDVQAGAAAGPSYAKSPQEARDPRSPDRCRALGGILVRKERWTLSLTGKLLALAVTVCVLFAVCWKAHPFLAVTSRVNGELLIIEGWIPTYTLNQAASEFARGHYQRVLVVRPVYETGDKYESGRYSGDYIAATLVQCGVPRDSVDTLFCSVVEKDRTYHSALAVKHWLEQKGIAAKSIDVATLGPHARRSRLLYEKAFGKDAKVGVIALEDREYEPAHWWRSSEGVREVLGEGIAYIYARFFFSAE